MAASRFQEDYSDSYHDDPIYQEPRSGKKKISSILTLVVLVFGGGLFVQSTLAANISLSSGAPIQFGQGVTLTTACSGSSSLTTIPGSSFTNASGSGSFKFNSLTVSNVPSGCDGFDLTINAFGNSSNTPLALFNSTSKDIVVYDNAGTFELDSSLSGISITSGAGTFTVTFSTPVALTSEVFKISMQSSAHALSCAQGGACSLDQTGPGGGTIAYYSAAGFSCGASLSSTCRYLEVAPNTWSGGSSDPIKPWSTYAFRGTNVTDIADNGEVPYNNALGIGLGLKNSNLITTQMTACASPLVIADCGYAAGAARAYRGGSLTDWYLPTTAELNVVCQWATGDVRGLTTACGGLTLSKGGFSISGYYWTSSEGNSSNGMYQMFTNDYQHGTQGKYSKTATADFGNWQVRPIRAF